MEIALQLRRETEIYVHELAHVIVGLGGPNSAGHASRLKTQAVWRQNSFFWRSSVFFLRLRTDGVRTTHVLEDNMLFSKLHHFSVN